MGTVKMNLKTIYLITMSQDHKYLTISIHRVDHNHKTSSSNITSSFTLQVLSTICLVQYLFLPQTSKTSFYRWFIVINLSWGLFGSILIMISTHLLLSRALCINAAKGIRSFTLFHVGSYQQAHPWYGSGPN